MNQIDQPLKRGRGRPRGSKNKPKTGPLLPPDTLTDELTQIARSLVGVKKEQKLSREGSERASFSKPRDIPRLPSSTAKLSDALRAVLGMDPAEAERRLAERDAPTVADMIALATAKEAISGNMKAVEQIADRTEGRPTTQTPAVADGMVDRLVRLLVVGAKAEAEKRMEEKQDAIQAELVTSPVEQTKLLATSPGTPTPTTVSTDPDDLPMSQWGTR